MPIFVEAGTTVIAMDQVVLVEYDPHPPLRNIGPEIHLRLRNGETYPVAADSATGRQLLRWRDLTARLVDLYDAGPEPLPAHRLASLAGRPWSDDRPFAYGRPVAVAGAAHHDVPFDAGCRAGRAYRSGVGR